MSVNETDRSLWRDEPGDLPSGCEPRERGCQFVLALREALEVELPLGIGLRELGAGPSEREFDAGKWEASRILH